MKKFIILHTTVYVFVYEYYRIGEDSKDKVFLLFSTHHVISNVCTFLVHLQDTVVRHYVG